VEEVIGYCSGEELAEAAEVDDDYGAAVLQEEMVEGIESARLRSVQLVQQPERLCLQFVM
jgi:hypothetical protein